MLEALEGRDLLDGAGVMGPVAAGAVRGVAQAWPGSTGGFTLPALWNSAGSFENGSDNGHWLLGLDALRADPRFSGFRGSGFSTVVIDTGIAASHPFFGPDANGDGVADRILYQYNFAGNISSAFDINGHGSNVAGAVASSGESAPGIVPEAGIIALGVFGANGSASFSNVERALRWTINNAQAYNIASINLSLGDNGNYNQPFSMGIIGDELATLAQMGVIVVAAAGNSFYEFGGQQGVSYPAADPNVISVGAVYAGGGGTYTYGGGAQGQNIAGAIAPFSQRSSFLDVFAPGAPVVGPAPGGGTVSMHGTSQAAPMISGLAVIAQQMAWTLLGRRLDLTEFRQILVSTASIIWDGPEHNDDAMETDNVPNTGASFRLASAYGMAEAIWAMVSTTSAPVPVNVAPTIGAGTTVPGRVGAGGIVLSHQRLLELTGAADENNEPVLLRVTAINSGALLVNGQQAVGGQTVIRPGDTVVWRPASGATGNVTGFTVRASDERLDSSSTAQVRFRAFAPVMPALNPGIDPSGNAVTAGVPLATPAAAPAMAPQSAIVSSAPAPETVEALPSSAELDLPALRIVPSFIEAPARAQGPLSLAGEGPSLAKLFAGVKRLAA
jgi:hypothetical protein